MHTCDMPARRTKAVKSRAMNLGPLSDMMRGRASGNSFRARWRIVSTSSVVIRPRNSLYTRQLVAPSRIAQR